MANFIDKSKGGIGYRGIALIVFLFILVLWLMITGTEKLETTSSPQSPSQTFAEKPAQTQPSKTDPATLTPSPSSTKEEPVPRLPQTPAEYLQAAKDQLSMKSENYPYGDIYQASYLLSHIPQTAPEYSEAQKLLKKITKLKEKDLASIREKTAIEKHTKRLLYAAIIENRFLDKGYDITVKVLGKNATTLQLKYILTSRVMVHHISKDASLIQEWRDLGFKHIVFTDGFRSKWIMDL